MGYNNKNVQGVDEVLKRLESARKYLTSKVFIVIGVESVNHFKDSFQNEGFTDKSLSKWDARKTKRSGSTNGQKVLSFSGELADSIDYRVQKPTVIIYSDKLYAQIHNEGGEIAVTSKMRAFFWAKSKEAKDAGDTIMQEQYKFMALAETIKVPQRKFAGKSEVLNNKIISKIERDLSKILKQ